MQNEAGSNYELPREGSTASIPATTVGDHSTDTMPFAPSPIKIDQDRQMPIDITKVTLSRTGSEDHLDDNNNERAPFVTTTPAEAPKNCFQTTKTFARSLLPWIPAIAPSVLFGALGYENASTSFYGFDVGLSGWWLEVTSYPLLCFLVNLATAKESHVECVEISKKLLSQDAATRERIGFLGSAVVAVVAMLATIPMAQDSSAKIGMTSENEYLNKFYGILSIICLSVFYTVATRLSASFGLIFKEIPQFVGWTRRKAALLFTQDVDSQHFKKDLQVFAADLKTERQLRLLNDYVLNELLTSLENPLADRIAVLKKFLSDTEYRLFPSKKKLCVTAALVAGTPSLGFLLYKLAFRGANTLGLYTQSASVVAFIAMIMTEIFYVRACIKFYDRIANGFTVPYALLSSTQRRQLLRDNNAPVEQTCLQTSKQLFYVFLYVAAAFMIALSTSSSFIVECEKDNANSACWVREAWKLVWTIYAGLVANGGYLALSAANIAQSRLDAHTVAENDHISLKGNAVNLRIQYQNVCKELNNDDAKSLRRLIEQNNPSFFSKLSSCCFGKKNDRGPVSDGTESLATATATV